MRVSRKATVYRYCMCVSSVALSALLCVEVADPLHDPLVDRRHLCHARRDHACGPLGGCVIQVGNQGVVCEVVCVCMCVVRTGGVERVGRAEVQVVRAAYTLC